MPKWGSPPAAASKSVQSRRAQALDHARKIVVKPSFEYRLQHFTEQVLECARVVYSNSLLERIEGPRY